MIDLSAVHLLAIAAPAVRGLSFAVWISVLAVGCGLLVGYATRYLFHHGRFFTFWIELVALGLAGSVLMGLIGEKTTVMRLVLAVEFLWLSVGFVCGLLISPVDKPNLQRCRSRIAADRPDRLILVKPRAQKNWRRIFAFLTVWALFWNLFVGLVLRPEADAGEYRAYQLLLGLFFVVFLAVWLLVRAPVSRLTIDGKARRLVQIEKKATKWELSFDEIRRVTFSRIVAKSGNDFHITLALATAAGKSNIVDEGIDGAYLAAVGKKIAQLLGVPFDDLQDALDHEVKPEDELGGK